MFTVIATATDYIVVSSSTQANFTISSENNLFTITNQTTNFSVVSTQTAVTVATLAGGFEFNSNYLGEWTTGTYVTNNLVTSNQSLYVLNYPYAQQYNSTTVPEQDSTWRRVVWHEAPFNVLTATRATFVGTATFGGPATFNNTATFAGRTNFVGTLTSDWIVTENFVLNGLTYPHNRGAYGQVLFTNGTDIANWVNLGDLQNWSLSEDLYTNGFNIVSGSTSTNLKIGMGTSGNLSKHIAFNPTNIELRGETKMYGDVYIEPAGFQLGNLVVANDIECHNVIASGNLYGTTVDVTNVEAGNITSSGQVTADTVVARIGLNGQTLAVGNYIQFSDGSRLYTATTATSTSSGLVPIATSSQLGIVKIGARLSITGDGTLSADDQSNPYTLPTASTSTLGGVKIGSGIVIDGSGVISVNTLTISSATVGVVSLTQDAYTNGYKITSGSIIAEYFLQFGTTSTYLGGGGAGIGSLYINPQRLDLSHPTAVNLTSNGIHLQSSGDLELETSGTTDLYIHSSNASADLSLASNRDVKISSARNVLLSSSTATIVGTGGASSILRVQNIYNYAGTYAPTFPAGIQFGDNSVQFTAFTTSSLYQQYFDFQNPYDP
jgi:hypothetical protein